MRAREVSAPSGWQGRLGAGRGEGSGGGGRELPGEDLSGGSEAGQHPGVSRVPRGQWPRTAVTQGSARTYSKFSPTFGQVCRLVHLPQKP